MALYTLPRRRPAATVIIIIIIRLFVAAAAAEQFVTADRWRRRVRARRGLCPTQSVRNHRNEHFAHAGLVRAGLCVVLCVCLCVFYRLPETVVGYFISSKVSRFFFFQTCLSTNTKRIKVDPYENNIDNIVLYYRTYRRRIGKFSRMLLSCNRRKAFRRVPPACLA